MRSSREQIREEEGPTLTESKVHENGVLGDLEDSERAGLDKLPAKLARYAKAHARALKMAGYLKHLPPGEPNPGEALKDAEKLCTCGEWLHFRHYFTVDELRLVDANFCSLHKLCPFCAIRRGSKQLARYLERFESLIAQEGLLRPFLVTLTVKNGPDLKDRFKHLQKAVKRLVDRRRQVRSGNGRGKTQFRGVHSAVGAYEVTNRGKGWHPHAHLICLFDREPDQKALASEWAKSTGDSFIVDIRPMTGDAIAAFCEVFKYAIKFQDMSLQDNWRAHVTLKNARLIFSLGGFRNVPEVTEADSDGDLFGLPYVDLIYRYLASSGVYSLDREESPDV